MRILFINTMDDKGGAAVIMQRLMKGLSSQYGTENHLLVKMKGGNAADTEQLLTHRFPVLVEKMIDRVSRPAGLLYQFFPFSSQKLLAGAKSFKPDIINLHNTHGAYFATPLLKKLSRVAPVVWTLHDMWSFTANAVHTFGNMSWKNLRNDRHLTRIPPSIGINTGSLLLRQKKKIYDDADLTIVTPSLWLKELAMQSPVFTNTPVHHIYNGVDTALYKPLDKQAVKQRLGIPPDRPTILFSSHFLTNDNPWKGGRDLVEILRRLNALTDRDLCFLAVGSGRMDELSAFPRLDIRYTGYLHGERDMIDCLNGADLLIYPTRADNLPNVLVESIACGTPAITFDIGGNKEIITHGQNGIIIPPFDLDAFAKSTLALLGDPEKRKQYSANGLVKAKEQFDCRIMTDRYYRLFQQKTENQR